MTLYLVSDSSPNIQSNTFKKMADRVKQTQPSTVTVFPLPYSYWIQYEQTSANVKQ